MAAVPPLRRRPRRSDPRLTRNVKMRGYIVLAGSPVPDRISRREASYLRRSRAVEGE